MWLIIDDAKEACGYDIVARTAQAGIAILTSMPEAIDHLYIDFDLGLRSGNHNGSDVIKFAIEADCLPKHVSIVSMNPPGQRILRGLLEDAGYVSKEGFNYYKND